MPTATVRWVTGKQFVGMDSNAHSVVLSGEDKANGLRPSEMLLVALASCSAVDVVEILAKKRMVLTRLEITADGQRDPEPPWPYRTIHLTYVLAGKKLTENGVRQAISLSEQKYCSVAATIRGVAEITTEFRIVPEEDKEDR